MKIALEEANHQLRAILRTIDKRVEFTSALTEGETPGINLTINRRERTKVITIPVDALAGVDEDAIKRHELRNRIKRAYDRMLYQPFPIASTKTVRGAASSDGYFRSSGPPRR